MNSARYFLFLCVLCICLKSQAVEFSELERLQGFAEHNRKNAEMNRERLSGADEVKKQRQEWDENRRSAVKEYKESQKEQAKAVDENSPDYQEYLKKRKEGRKEHEEAREEYAKEQHLKKARRKSLVLLTEEEELGLVGPEDRTHPRNRNMNAGKASGLGPSTASSRGGRGSTDFGSPSHEFAPPPPPPPPMPEFYEPEGQIPPPPPPPEFEEPIPPPIIDDGDF